MLSWLLLSLSGLTWAGPVHDALAVGDCATALSDTATELSPATQLALARCAINLNDPERALVQLKPVHQDLWAGHAAALRGRAHLAQGNPIDAVQSLQTALADARVAASPVGERRRT